MFNPTQKRSGLILLFTLMLTACAPATSTPTSAPTPTFADEDVSHIVTLAKMEGHLRVSLPLWEAGNYELAAIHASHPMAELFSLVEADLKAKQADAPLRAALDAYAALAGEAGEAAKVKVAHQAALDAVQTAEQSLAGSLADDLAFQTEVIHGLLQGVEEEYGEALGEGQIAEIVKYQEALGFFLTARIRYEAIAATFQAAHPNEHTQIEGYFIELEKALPEVNPPTPATDFKEVEGSVDGIVAELREAVGLKTEVTESPLEIIAATREKVEDSLKKYKAGETDEAYELAASAYLDEFEKIEADLTAQGGQELMQTLEMQFKDLRDGIKAGKPQAEIEQVASGINDNLDKAEALFK